MKPFIGITFFEEEKKDIHQLNTNYIRSVLEVGGLPLAIPTLYKKEDVKTYIEKLDGFLFTGGMDISPLTYGQNPIKQIHLMSSRRDWFELELLQAALEAKKPILGICRGHQLLNVATGGSLIQDLEKQQANSLGHQPTDIRRDELYHNISLERPSILWDIFNKEEIAVNSFHHQAIDQLGNNLRITARSEDHIIESVEHTDHPFCLGVQFHPEGLSDRYSEFLAIFSKFVSACA